MESTGVKGKIQVSYRTAQILKDAGKEQWLTPRIDMVEAKGMYALAMWHFHVCFF